MFSRTYRALHISITVMTTFAPVAFAGFNVFTDKADWESAAGTSFMREDFNSFTHDVRIVDAPVPLNNMTVFGKTTFRDGDGAQIVTPPFDANSDSLDGSSYLTTIIRGPVDFVRFDFRKPVSAWGANTKGVSNGGRITDILVYDATDTLLGTIHPLTPLDPLNPNHPLPMYESFYGFSLTDTLAAYLVWENNGFGDAFSIDNIVFIAVPEPSTLLLTVIVCAAFGTRRNTRPAPLSRAGLSCNR